MYPMLEKLLHLVESWGDSGQEQGEASDGRRIEAIIARRPKYKQGKNKEALIPVEVGEPTLRYFQADEESNSEAMLINLELLEGRRELAHVRLATQKQRMEQYYNQRTNLHYFKVGELVLRKVTQNTRELNAGKLGSIWEGPYRISTITDKGSYELENRTGDKLPSNWNMAHLKKYYC
ncbi:uncharacterized protein LOC142173727 [Nicotiana tabacum]|uniref:Uncharacterized protein LOC142173727 n=1 Tax=Nicotiana tabacum TaxID=4097 RepID=A0AC58TE17_TOBAC